MSQLANFSRRTLGGAFSYESEIPIETLEILDITSGKDYWYEIINAGIGYRLDYNREFNQEGYVARTKRNKKMAVNKKKTTKETHLTEDYEENGGGVSLNLIKEVDNSYDNIIKVDERLYLERELKRLHTELLYEGINLKLLMQQAMDNLATAVNQLRELCATNSEVGEIIKQALCEGVSLA